MCLISTTKESYTATKDLVVYKELIEDNGEYLAPYTEYLIKLNSNLIAEGIPNIRILSSGFYAIDIGFIHAYIGPKLRPLTYNSIFVKAIIPKGAKYYLGLENDIAVDQMFITDKLISKAEACKLYYEFVTDTYNKPIGITIGDYYLGNNKFIHYNEYNKKLHIEGIVAFFNTDNHPVIIKPRSIKGTSCYTKDDIPYFKLYDVMNGYENTECAKNNMLTEDCIYSKCISDWYVPSAGEMYEIIKNSIVINSSIYQLRGSLLNEDSYYLTSSCFNDKYYYSINSITGMIRTEVNWQKLPTLLCKIIQL